MNLTCTHKPAIRSHSMSLDELLDRRLPRLGCVAGFAWLKVTRVLGLLTLYLFLDSYDVRAKFNRRTADRLREEAHGKGWLALSKMVARHWSDAFSTAEFAC